MRFLEMNEFFLGDYSGRTVITFSHFLPRIDVMPFFIPPEHRRYYAMLGTSLLERQVRTLKPRIHVYGHSHVNNRVVKDDTIYINNAFGYPYEFFICAKKLRSILEI